MTDELPRLQVPRAHAAPDLAIEGAWAHAATITPFLLASGNAPAKQQTVARLYGDREALYVRFDCDDRDIWGTFTQRDEPIYNEEVVEVFIGPGRSDPTHYCEFEVSPNGVLLDARIYNPTSTRDQLQVDETWLCPGIHWAARRDDAGRRWWAALAIPWAAITSDRALPKIWRANFYRIERARDGEPEYSCWSSTLTEPADFHKPARFGILELQI